MSTWEYQYRMCGYVKNPESSSYEHDSILKVNIYQIISLAVKQRADLEVL